jgi:hypothetical protein
MHQSTTALETIPGIGPSLARDLRDLGFSEPAELRARNPEQMFEDLCELRAQKIDRCVLYTFRCAVYYASNEKHDAELLKWWNWKDRASRLSRGNDGP